MWKEGGKNEKTKFLFVLDKYQDVTNVSTSLLFFKGFKKCRSVRFSHKNVFFNTEHGKVPLTNGGFRKLTEESVYKRQRPFIFKPLIKQMSRF